MAKEYVEDLAKIPRASLESKRIRLAIIGCGESKFMKVSMARDSSLLRFCYKAKVLIVFLKNLLLNFYNEYLYIFAVGAVCLLL